jgi:leader peptidase (prepilin peptidase)/N-methyltransferase
VLEAAAGALVGVCAGAVTPPVARRYRVAARWWAWAPVGAIAGTALGWRLGALPAPGQALALWLVVLAVGVPLAAIDLGAHRLPDPLVLPATALVATLAVVIGSPRALLGGAALVTAYAALALLPRSGLGFGDVKLAGALGTALAALGWAPVVWGTAFAFGLGGGVALLLLAAGRARRDTHLPFGPAMLAGALLAALAA